MDRARIWPEAEASWIVHEDDDLLVVDKPAGVPCQAADPRVSDDLPSRLSRWLAARDGLEKPAYLGIHQRLDAATSGLLVYARRKEANGALARAFEGRLVDKRYVAVVRGLSPKIEQTTLRQRLRERSQGTVEATDARDPKGRDAVTHLRVVRRVGTRALVELRIETGRTHQIRVQLAELGAPVVGDPLYGGEAAPRLMLHASRLELAHPTKGERVAFVRETPPDLVAWLERKGDDPFRDDAELQHNLVRAVQRRWALGRAPDFGVETTAFRLVNESGDGLPGLAVDLYGSWVVVQLYDDAARAAESRISDAFQALGFDGVYVKRRPKQASTLVDPRKEEVAPASVVRGKSAPEELVVREHGVPFLVRLGEGLSTGLFLDQRENRRRMGELCRGQRLLNLFCYTAGFSVTAALAGARESVSIDASANVLAWARRNFTLSSVGSAHELVTADVFEALTAFERARRQFDVVILDPPTFSTTHASTFNSGTSYRALVERVFRVVAPQGRLLACSNDRRLVTAKLRRYLHEAARGARRQVAQMKDLPTQPDFPAPPGQDPFMKSVLVTLR